MEIKTVGEVANLALIRWDELGKADSKLHSLSPEQTNKPKSHPGPELLDK